MKAADTSRWGHGAVEMVMLLIWSRKKELFVDGVHIGKRNEGMEERVSD